MRRCFSLALLGLAFALLASTVEAQTPALPKPPAKPDPKASREQTFGKDFVLGQLVALADKRLTIEYTWRKVTVNQEAYDRLVQLQAEYNNALAIEDPLERFQALQAIIAEGRDKQKMLYETEDRTDQQELDITAATKVRQEKLPAKDAQGKPIKYTDQQLRELKGPGNLPGYTAKLDDLKEGQKIRVHFVKRKAEANPFIPNPPDVYFFEATMIVIVEGPPEPK